MKTLAIISLGAALLSLAGVALGETSAVSPSGFLVTHHREVRATPLQVYEAIGRIGRWWNDVHSYSGHSSNMTLVLAAGGCFCEAWTENSVQHAQVIQARPGSLVRLQGALGPLQPLAVNAVLSFAISATGDKAALAVTYNVAGNPDAGLDKLAPAVDSVIGDATDRLVAYVETGKP